VASPWSSQPVTESEAKFASTTEPKFCSPGERSLLRPPNKVSFALGEQSFVRLSWTPEMGRLSSPRVPGSLTRPGGLALVQSAGHGERSEVCFDHRTKVSFARRTKFASTTERKFCPLGAAEYPSTLVDPREGVAEFSQGPRVSREARCPGPGPVRRSRRAQRSFLRPPNKVSFALGEQSFVRLSWTLEMGRLSSPGDPGYLLEAR
jgi:hypothetical protein